MRQGQSELSNEQIHQKLLEMFNAKASNDDLFSWINVSFLLKILARLYIETIVFQANVGERVKEKQFIRTLATAIFENSIVKNKLNTETLKSHYSLIHRFVDNKPEYELQCLFALQALINKLEHPQGILIFCCFYTMENLLYFCCLQEFY